MLRSYYAFVRTTLNIDTRVLEAARALAEEKGISLGSAVSELALRGLRIEALSSPRSQSPFPTFPVSPDDDLVTQEMVQRALNEL